ncbi:MAG: hypothetical protein ACRECO_13940 [Xanthobacteraceae bacterium]
MKMTAVTAALVVAFASPVFAQEYQEWNQMLAAPSAEDAYAQQVQGADAFASTIIIVRPGHSDNPAWDVYDGTGEYVGSDPDPFIRNTLRSDPPGQNDD